jgi:hypothetical protein
VGTFSSKELLDITGSIEIEIFEEEEQEQEQEE